VAGSGKTPILEFRAEVLAGLLNKPILVLCFNTTLAAKLGSHMRSKGIANICGAINRFINDWAPHEGIADGDFCAIEGHGCAGLRVSTSVLK